MWFGHVVIVAASLVFVATGASGCAAPRSAPSPALKHFELRMGAKDAAEPRWDLSRDGWYTVRYENGQILAEGELRQALPVGRWRYFLADGSKFAEGSYAPAGCCTGEWILYDKRGQPDRHTRSGMQCDGYTLVQGPAGILRFTYRDVQDAHRSDVQQLMRPLNGRLWDGTGTYDSERGRIDGAK
ncbi:MAG: hypothetical protein EPO68_09450 [Planctomycetota bacterium]|nr:MAG: hypothetical protein EPO68_09450 [Planctomycetota bacterium]